jgi:hypothetical protein
VLIAGPIEVAGFPIAAGADGTIYVYMTPRFNADKQRDRLTAYSLDLKELWRLELPDSGAGLIGNVILDDDGMMYVARGGKTSGLPRGLEVLAIQTRSPGLADSSWPSLRHDNRGTSWLVPGKRGAAGADGEARSTDAGADVPLAPGPV